MPPLFQAPSVDITPPLPPPLGMDHDLHTGRYEPQPLASSVTAGRVNFADIPAAFAPKSTFELALAWAVLKSCSFSPLVARADTIYHLANKVFGKTITGWAVRQTFFRHFCAGESQESILPTVSVLCLSCCSLPFDAGA